MTWLRLDDKMARHPKIAGLSDAAFRLHVNAMLYCAEQQTDGHILSIAVPTLTAHKSKTSLIEELVDAGLWHSEPDGWSVHDYLDWNPSKEESEQRRAARAAAGRVGGLRSGESRRDHEAHDEANGKQLLEGLLRTGANPDPSSIEDPNGSSSADTRRRIGLGVQAVYQHWLKVLAPMKFKRAPTLNPERRRAIVSRLKDFSVADLCLAIDGVKKSPYHCGENERREPYVDIPSIFGNRTKVEAHMARADGPALASADPRDKRSARMAAAQRGDAAE